MKTRQAEGLLLLVTLIWGGTFLFTKVGLDDCDFSLYLTLRFTVALVPALVLFGGKLRYATKKMIRNGAVLGFFFGAGFVLQTLGLKYTEVSNSAFITGLTTPITPFIAYLLIRSKIKAASIVGVAVAFIGLTVFTNPFAGDFNNGDFLTFLSAFCWAFYIVYMDIFTKSSDGNETRIYLVMQLATSFVMCLATFLIFDARDFVLVPTRSLLVSLLFNGLLASLAVTFIQTFSQRYTTPVKAVLIFTLEPVFATLFSVIFRNETLGLLKIIGGLFMLSGILISEVGPYLKSKLGAGKQ